MRISDWSSDVCCSDLVHFRIPATRINLHPLIAQADHALAGLMTDQQAKDLSEQPLDAGFSEDAGDQFNAGVLARSEEHTSEFQSLMRISYAVFCLKKKRRTVTQR